MLLNILPFVSIMSLGRYRIEIIFPMVQQEKIIGQKRLNALPKNIAILNRTHSYHVQ